jgi:predicted nucleotidyltransferase component of viral defense system
MIEAIRLQLDPLLGIPTRRYSKGISTIVYKVLSLEGFPLKLKIETNCREQFTVCGYRSYHFSSKSSWAPGEVIIKSFSLEELLGTKLRALYQRRKGRDLFDLYTFLKAYPMLNIDEILACFSFYTQKNGPIAKNILYANLQQKLEVPEFRNDIVPLLPLNRPVFDPDVAFEYLRTHLLDRL